MLSKINDVELWAPPEYWDTPAEAVDLIASGCGPGGLGDYLIPDTVYFLSIRQACRIHDFMYFEGCTEEDRCLADQAFLNNMLRIVQARTKCHLLKKLRMRRCKTYYQAVHWFGGPFFWVGKEAIA